MIHREHGAIGKGIGWFALFIVLLFFGCSVGPDFTRPEVAVSENWLDANDRRVKTAQAEYRNWWKAFNDPVLDKLIDLAYSGNLSLRIAGVRVLEARAQLGIATGQLYPQTQQVSASVQRIRTSERSQQAALLKSLPAPSLPSATFSSTGRTRPGLTQAGRSISGGSSDGLSSQRTRLCLRR